MPVIHHRSPSFQISGVTVHDESLHCAWGLMSTDGWAAYDDSANWGLDKTFWQESPNTDEVDTYFFGHGWDYKVGLNWERGGGGGGEGWTACGVGGPDGTDLSTCYHALPPPSPKGGAC